MSTLKIALRYGAAGFKVFPIKPGFKTPPLVKWGAQSSSDAATITKWWTKTPNANIGLACGQSGIAVIDIDTKEGRRGQQTIDALEVADGLKLTPTRMQRTPSGGLQYFLSREHSDVAERHRQASMARWRVAHRYARQSAALAAMCCCRDQSLYVTRPRISSLALTNGSIPMPRSHRSISGSSISLRRTPIWSSTKSKSQ